MIEVPVTVSRDTGAVLVMAAAPAKEVVPALVWVTGVVVITAVVLDTVLVRITGADLVPVPSLAANKIQAFSHTKGVSTLYAN